VGIAQVPLVITHDYLRTGALVKVLPDWRLPETEICALFHSGRTVAPRVRAFLDFLVEALAPPLREAAANETAPLHHNAN
jgi:DNA-binding transcriptional LysR family regulator